MQIFIPSKYEYVHKQITFETFRINYVFMNKCKLSLNISYLSLEAKKSFVLKYIEIQYKKNQLYLYLDLNTTLQNGRKKDTDVNL